MAILLYCIAKVDAPTAHPPAGVAGDTVVRVELGNLAAFTSNNPDKSNWLRLPLQTPHSSFIVYSVRSSNRAPLFLFAFPPFSTMKNN
jgi:hypothetical protein